MKSNCRFFLFCLFFMLLAVALPAQTELMFLHTNDTHARLIPFSHKTHGPDSGGIVRRSGLVNSIREKYPHALLLDAGDMFQGTPFYNIFKGEACHRAAVACGYDATTLGNHELDNSFENLQMQLQKSGMRLLCCNVFYRGTAKHAFKPYHVFIRNGYRIGVIGSIGNDAFACIDIKTKAGLESRDQTLSVRETAKKIRPYTDFIVVLSHAGIIEDKQMAAEISEIDLIIGGHSHEELQHPLLITNKEQQTRYNNGLNGTIVAQAGEHGIFLGQVKLTVNAAGKIATFTGGLTRVTAAHEATADPELKKLVAGYHDQLNQTMQQVAGFSATAMDIPKEKKKTHILPMGTFTAQAMLEAGKGDICLVNSGAIREGLSSGKLTYGDIYESLPYDNTVVTFSMKGSALKQMLDYICENFYDLDGFQFAGIEAEFNLKEKLAKNIIIDGKPLDHEKDYRVSTSSFVANGNLHGDKLFGSVEKIEDSGVFMREAAIEYLLRVGDMPDFSAEKVSIVRRGDETADVLMPQKAY